MLWIPITVGAATLQVARNVFQRTLVEGAGAWGAALVRFLFGLPFSLIFAVSAVTLLGGHLAFSPRFWAAEAVGSAAQAAAMGAILVSMRRSGFAVATVFQQSSIPLAAVFGLFLGDRLDQAKWIGIALTTGGLAALAWPRRAVGEDWKGAVAGLVAGALFALSANAFRASALALAPGSPFLAAAVSLFVAQGLQTVGLGTWLVFTDRPALRAVISAWRRSLAAGFLGSAGSGLWFAAVALSPAGPVRAVGVVDVPIAAIAGRRIFAERLGARQAAGAAAATAGVVLAALG
ncbi:MAG TPA: EamA/RhaT family transporter [Caulobacteraceae bacterium]|nr:EamA/RhaT family transporter [Caulobacteraceae bacterium]